MLLFILWGNSSQGISPPQHWRNRMKLMTKAIINALPKLYATEGIAVEDKTVICKFFTPWGNWTWYVFEGEKQEDGDYLFFGMVHGFETELIYFSLSELQSFTGPFGLKIERDKWFFKKPYRDHAFH